MKKIKFKGIIGFLIFLVVGVLLFQEINLTIVEKSTYGRYLSFNKMENVNVLFLGSSHSDNGIGAIDIENKISKELGTEVDVFNYSIYGMRLEQMYYVLKELLGSKKPELIVIETFSFVETKSEDKEILARRAFDYFPLNANKVNAIKYCTETDRASYYFPIIKYHTRWKELTKQDYGYRFKRELWDNMGREYNTVPEQLENQDEYFSQDFSNITDQQKLGNRSEEKLQDILKLAEDNGIQVLFFGIPYKIQLGVSSVESIKMNNYVEANYVNGNNVQMYDLNKEMNQLNFGYHYLYNEGHCNEEGAKLVSDLVADYISEHYELLLKEEK